RSLGNVLRELRARGGVNGIGALEGFEIPESVEGLDDLFWIGQNRDRVRLEAGAGGMACFELALEDEGGEGELLGRQTKLGAKEDLGRPAPGESGGASKIRRPISFACTMSAAPSRVSKKFSAAKHVTPLPNTT